MTALVAFANNMEFIARAVEQVFSLSNPLNRKNASYRNPVLPHSTLQRTVNQVQRDQLRQYFSVHSHTQAICLNLFEWSHCMFISLRTNLSDLVD